MAEVTTQTNKYGETIEIGDVLFMSRPKSETFPQTFPESHYLVLVKSMRGGLFEGPIVNWKRNGGDYNLFDINDLKPKDQFQNNNQRGFRRATKEEVHYFFKRKPEYLKYAKTEMKK